MSELGDGFELGELGVEGGALRVKFWLRSCESELSVESHLKGKELNVSFERRGTVTNEKSAARGGKGREERRTNPRQHVHVEVVLRNVVKSRRWDRRTSLIKEADLSRENEQRGEQTKVSRRVSSRPFLPLLSHLFR